MIWIRRRLLERRLRRAQQAFELHCESCPSCRIAAFGNRQTRRKMHNPRFCYEAQPQLLKMEILVAQLHAAYGKPVSNVTNAPARTS